MKIYIVWRASGRGNKDILAVYKNKRKVEQLCEELKRNQGRSNNNYYYTEHEVEK